MEAIKKVCALGDWEISDWFEILTIRVLVEKVGQTVDRVVQV